ncbi:MAG: YihY/virulence factor BrkB family protein [Defluviitaleaceae bacterium]|nr:YihY/virulence factor BrkB family protein [Defluviitaleaceae bacterium]
MDPIKKFSIALVKEIIAHDLWGYANALTYKLLLALFPFIIFLMTLIGFFNIDASYFTIGLTEALPPEVSGIIDTFALEVVSGRNLSLLSVSLFVAVFSASSGFRAIIKGINKAYDANDTRGALFTGVISVGLVFLFAVSIIICLVVLIFGDYLMALADWHFGLSAAAFAVYEGFRYLGVMAALLAAVCAIYKISSCKRVKLLSVLPGAAVTVALWVLASKVFEIYIANFARFSVVYGGLGSVFVMMIWLNIVSFLLLVGSEINALLRRH